MAELEQQAPSEETKAWATLKDEIEAPEQVEKPAKEEAAKEVKGPTEAGKPTVKEGEAEKPAPTLEQLQTEHENVKKALQVERAQRKADAQRMQQFEQVFETMRERRAQRQAPAEREERREEVALPSFEEDPASYLMHQVKVLQDQLQQVQQGSTQTAEQIQAREEKQAMYQQIELSERDIKNPKSANHKEDYEAACEFLAKQRMGALELMYPDDDPSTINEARQYRMTPAQMRDYLFNQDMEGITNRALRSGRSPAMMYYDAAVKHGYAKTNVVPIDAKAKLEAARKGQAAANTISGSSRGKTASPSSLAELTDLAMEDPDAFDKEWDKLAAKGMLG